MTDEIRARLVEWAAKYNDPAYFQEDPISFPREFLRRGCDMRDVEVAAIFAAHFAWGRRAMIVRDSGRLFDEMEWRPFEYVMAGAYRDDAASIHRTVKWSEIAAICGRLREWYSCHDSLESLRAEDFRTVVFGQKENPKAANKKIHMMRRWLVRCDGRVDLGIWKATSPAELLMPLDVHVHRQALALGLTKRKQEDIQTVREITAAFAEIFPGDPVRGDFALFGYGVSGGESSAEIDGDR